jgi:phosphatidylglycerophosphatase A
MTEDGAHPEHPSRGPAWAVALSTAGGVGFSPKMPGTLGALVGVALYLPAHFMPREWVFTLALSEIAAVFILSALAVPRVVRATGLKDPQFVVIDEVAGQLCALGLVGPDLVRIALAFVCFRLLDIFKPWPIHRLEHLPGAWGVMADDVAAGLLAGLVTILVMRLS